MYIYKYNVFNSLTNLYEKIITKTEIIILMKVTYNYLTLQISIT